MHGTNEGRPRRLAAGTPRRMAMALLPAVLMGLIPLSAHAKAVTQLDETADDRAIAGTEAIVGWATFAYVFGVVLLGVCHLWWLRRAWSFRGDDGLDRA